jgi:hypothetical protein
MLGLTSSATALSFGKFGAKPDSLDLITWSTLSFKNKKLIPNYKLIFNFMTVYLQIALFSKMEKRGLK